jgi:hypothetical protein
MEFDMVRKGSGKEVDSHGDIYRSQLRHLDSPSTSPSSLYLSLSAQELMHW